jgi:diaminopropionate ammonia-lyase
MSAYGTESLSSDDLVFEHVENRLVMAGPYPEELKKILNVDGFQKARRVLTALPAYKETPLHSLDNLAHRLNLSAVYFKDESERLGLGSFKGVGGAYAVYGLLLRRAAALGIRDLAVVDLISGAVPQITADVTVACATTGNHGRSVARAAQMFGCRCVIYVPQDADRARVDALTGLGAEVVRARGNYDLAVETVALDADKNGWHVVSDTAFVGHTETPRDVMHGYRVICDEVVRQLPQLELPTHVFVQTGVGGIAAAFCSHFWELWGAARPRFISVESREAACMLRSAECGRLTVIHGELKTVMQGLAAGRPSLLAWEVLRLGCNDFVSIADAPALQAMKILASGNDGDPAIVVGEAGAAGAAGLLVANSTPGGRARLGLDSSSRVLLVGTEGAMDPFSYKCIVGRTAEEVSGSHSAPHGTLAPLSHSPREHRSRI